MTEPRFEPAIGEPAAEVEVLTRQEAVERLIHLADKLNGLYDSFMGQRSSYGLIGENATIWLHKVDAIVHPLDQFNVACGLYRRSLERSKQPVTEKDFHLRLAELRQQASQIAHQITLLQIEAKQYESVETQLAPEFSIQSTGASKPSWVDHERFAEHKLSRFGQDVMLVNRHKGSAVIADGTSTMPDSARVAAAVAQVADKVLRDIPDGAIDDLTELLWYPNTAIVDNILHALHNLPPETIGSTTLLAARYLSKFDALIVIEIGDCEAVLATASSAQQVSYATSRKGEVAHIQKFEGKDANIVDPQRKPLVRIIRVADFRREHPGEPIHLLGATDGFINNAKTKLVNQASQVVRDGVVNTVKRVGHSEDDIVMFDLELTPA